jgi:hypothetical protein
MLIPQPSPGYGNYIFGTLIQGSPPKYTHDPRRIGPRGQLAGERSDHLFSTDRDIRSSIPSHADWRAAKARRADRQAVHDYRQRLRRELLEHGHRQFLDRIEPNPDGGWRLHIFVADEAAMLLLDEFAEGMCDDGDPVSFDHEEFVREQLEEWINRTRGTIDE